MRESIQKMPQSLTTPQRRLCASLHKRHAYGHFRRLNENNHPMQELTGKMPCHRSLARACAIEMHMDVTKKQVMREFTGIGNAQKLGAHFVLHMGMSQNAILCEDLKEKCRAQKLAATFPASLRNRNAHGHVTRAIFIQFPHFLRQFARNMPRPKS